MQLKEVFTHGNIIQWLRDKMKFLHMLEIESFLNNDGNSKNVHFLPAFNGLGSVLEFRHKRWLLRYHTGF